MPIKITQEEFLSRAKNVHGDKYDYSKVNYVNSVTPICIVCREHGDFWQKPEHHILRAQGCPTCAKINRGLKTRDTTEGFITKARTVHGDRYDYSKVEYLGRSKKVCIICREHGEFWQNASNHIQGSDCPKCSGNYVPTTEEFIEKARKIHGDKYDYSKTVYKGNASHVCIICPEHGEFMQIANTHISGSGCPRCTKNYKHTTEDFIRQAREIHGQKYDYSKVVYEGNRKHIKIICPTHGEFLQTPFGHLQGNGCKKCGRERVSIAVSEIRKKTLESFISEAIAVHGNKYDYSKVNYEGANIKICIVCPEHGDIWISPSYHLSGGGCTECSQAIFNKSRKEEFIKRSEELHAGLYDYSKFEYLGYKIKSTIICPTHGEFMQTPFGHLQGNGCPDCGFARTAEARRLTTEDFIERAVAKHGDKYDYSKSIYVNSQTNVIINCPTHGDFSQNPNNHMNGAGCPQCATERMRDYFIGTTENFIKRAREVHGDKYDYSKVEYKGNKHNVCVICPEHGEFWTTPNNHLSGAICLECSRKANAIRQTKSFDDFVEKAQQKHGTTYDYSLARGEYKTRAIPIPIICKKHGTFWQVPTLHLVGHGCPICNESRLEAEVRLLLQRNGIIFEAQKTFSWLKYKGKMFLDFYLPEYKLVVECHGEQHFRPVKCFGGEENFEIVVDRDEHKKALCEKHGIKIIYYSNLGFEYKYDVIETTGALLACIKNGGIKVRVPEQLELEFDEQNNEES